MAAANRGRLLLKLADAIEDNAEELARLETIDTGHPIRDSSFLDVPRTAACFPEFGRMPFSQGESGRDHNGGTFVTWLAGSVEEPLPTTTTK